MPNVVDEKFSRFICEVGLRKDLAQQLWDANIQSPQELAGRDKSDLQKVIDDPLLVNHIHPVLKKHLFGISMAPDPYVKAVKIMKKYAKSLDDDEEDEQMVTSSGLSSDGIQSDANPYATERNVSTQEPTTRVEGSMPLNNDSARYNNNGTRLATNGHGFVQSHIGRSKGGALNERVIISGGNFVQSNILSSGPVTYNNTNTVISTTMDQSGKDDAQKRRNTLMDSCLFIGDTLVETARLGWMDRRDYWVDEINLPRADFDEYARHLRNNDVYKVGGKSRALILNNVTFRGGSNMTPRHGAEVDCERMQILLKDLGFIVQRENNKSAKDMLDILQSFAKSPENIGVDMTLVYIGSHGERDEQGSDMFVGSDGNRVAFNEVKNLFCPENAPLLVNLPKIFFLQFCRQESRPTRPLNLPPASPLYQTATLVADTTLVPDAAPVYPPVVKEETRAMDMICAYATLAGNKAYRDTADGSWFVTALLRVFTDHSHKEDLLSMLTKVNNLVSVNEGEEGSVRAIQISEVVHNLRKKLYFYPKLNAT